MKKLMAMLLSVVLCLGVCSFCAAEEMNPDYVGAWKLDSVSLMGVSLSKDELDWTSEMYIYKNGDCFFIKDDIIAVLPLVPQNGAYIINAGDVVWPLMLNEQGLLELEMAVEGLVMDLTMARNLMPVETDAQCLSFVGDWRLNYVDLLGIQLGEEELGKVDMKIYDSGYGILNMEGVSSAFRLILLEEQVLMLDSEGMTFPIRHGENGLIIFELIEEGLTMKFVMEPASI